MGFTRMYFDEGRQENVMLTTNRLLSLRFKTVPEWADELMKKAGQRDLEQWTDRILNAKTIEEMFGRQQ